MCYIWIFKYILFKVLYPCPPNVSKYCSTLATLVLDNYEKKFKKLEKLLRCIAKYI